MAFIHRSARMPNLSAPFAREEHPWQPAYTRNTGRPESGSLTELTHADRIAIMGRLAASIPHEVNQPIAAMVKNAQAALRLHKTRGATFQFTVGTGGLIDTQSVADASHTIKGDRASGLKSSSRPL